MQLANIAFNQLLMNYVPSVIVLTLGTSCSVIIYYAGTEAEESNKGNLRGRSLIRAHHL